MHLEAQTLRIPLSVILPIGALTDGVFPANVCFGMKNVQNSRSEPADEY
jgi:hypothetical protein